MEEDLKNEDEIEDNLQMERSKENQKGSGYAQPNLLFISNIIKIKIWKIEYLLHQ